MLKRAFAALSALLLALSAAAAAGQESAGAVKWGDGVLKQKPEWYASDEAVRVADNVLAYQRDSGGWPKNIDMAKPLNESQRAALLKEKAETDSTIDNGATYQQLVYLARVHGARPLERHREGFLRGIDYLLKAQYENGGWPQYYPTRKGYYTHITFNDGAMINVMRLLRDVARAKAPYEFVDAARRASAAKAVERGVECILKTQVLVEGKRTVWAAQYDEVTLEPAAARRFEPVSLTGHESVGVVRFLMGYERQDARVREAVESAVEWFRAAKVSGVRWVERRDPSKPGGFERAAVRDPKAPPIWGRFYEIGTNRPIFIGRDAVIHYDVSEIEEERRNGYRWYTEEPAELLEKDYPAWQKKVGGAAQDKQTKQSK